MNDEPQTHDEEAQAEPTVETQETPDEPKSPAASAQPAAEPKRLTDLKWYTVRTYSGHERKVKEHIDKETDKQGAREKLAQVFIPYEKFVEVKDGKKKSRTKNAFPGYVLVEAVLDKQTKSIILETPSVIGFLGVGDVPIPLRPDEVKRILEPEQEQERRAAMKAPFEIGNAVKITDGPFSSLTGVVQEINSEKMKVKVLINFFGRSTPTEVDFSQVKPVTN